MVKRIFFTLLLCSFSCLFTAHAQVYTHKKSQHRFAQSYLGLNTQWIPSGGQIFVNGQVQAFPFIMAPRINIGGLHFWGKVDFNMNFPLARIGDFSLDSNADLIFNPGGDLSVRYYPWRVRYGKLLPFLGVSFNEMKLGIEKEGQGSREDLMITTSLLGGLSYTGNGWQINAELMWMLDNTRDFYSSQTHKHTYEMPQSYLSVGVLKYFEGTLKEEADKQSGRIYELENQMRAENKLNSWSVAVAPSGAYFLHAPNYSSTPRVSLPRHKTSFVWDFGLGYLFHDTGLHLGLTFRDYTSGVESYGFEQQIRRQSLAFEALKFFWNYNGFVPFVGPTISFERWAAGEFKEDEQIGKTHRTRKISPGIIFGWDILASPLETWVLRTNLRYYPFQKIKGMDGRIIRVDQFEFNFIQLVIYPSRLKHFPPLKGRI